MLGLLREYILYHSLNVTVAWSPPWFHYVDGQGSPMSSLARSTFRVEALYIYGAVRCRTVPTDINVYKAGIWTNYSKQYNGEESFCNYGIEIQCY